MRTGITCLAAVTWFIATPASGQTVPRIWEGVYTAAQAERGAEIFETACSHCHGPDLGGADGPALVGSTFMRNWLETTVHNLFMRILTTMPAGRPGSLPEADVAQLTSFLLARNGFPAGPDELDTRGDVLKRIRIVGRDGPGPVPDFSFVEVVGCLASAPDGGWTLTQGTEPVRAQDVDATAADAQRLVDLPAGPHTYDLMDAEYQNPEDLANSKVLVKGLLIRQANPVRINVSALAGTGRKCES